MKHVRLKDNVRLVGIKENRKGRNRKVSYYLQTDKNEMLYAFSRNYSRHTMISVKQGFV